MIYEGVWGDWSDWMKVETEGEFIVGYNLKNQGYQGRGDDSALNGITLITGSAN